MEFLARALSGVGALEYGPIDMMCHILPTETHHGIWVGQAGLRGSASTAGAPGWIGVYRCQDHFWGILLTANDVSDVIARPDALISSMQIGQLAGNPLKEVADLGPMRLGVDSLAAALASIEYETLGDDDVEALEEPDESSFEFEELYWQDNGQIAWDVIASRYEEEEVPADEVPSLPRPSSEESAAGASVASVVDVMAPLDAWHPAPIDGVDGVAVQLVPPGLSDVDTHDGASLEVVRATGIWRYEFVLESAWHSHQPATRLGAEETYVTARGTALQVAVQIVALALDFLRGVEYPHGPHRCNEALLSHDFEGALDDAWVRENVARAEVYLATLLQRGDLEINERAFIEWILRRDYELQDLAQWAEAVFDPEDDQNG